MHRCPISSWAISALLGLAVLDPLGTVAQSTQAAQRASQAPSHKPSTFEEFVSATIAQEQRLTKLMRNFKPIVETYIQEQKSDPDVLTSPKDDLYFLSRV